ANNSRTGWVQVALPPCGPAEPHDRALAIATLAIATLAIATLAIAPSGGCPRSPSEARVLLGAPHEWARAPLGFAAGYSDLVRPHESPYGGPHAPAGLSGHPASELNLGNPAAQSLCGRCIMPAPPAV